MDPEVRHPEKPSRRIPRAVIPSRSSQDLWRGLGEGWSYVSYLIVGIGFWGGVGYLVDAWAGTKPVLFVIGALLGNFAGIYLIYARTMADERADRRAS